MADSAERLPRVFVDATATLTRAGGRGPAVALTLIMIGVALIRVRLLDFPLERDEGEFAYLGQRLLQGYPPYDLAYTMKWPGTASAYAVIMSVFGQTPRGIHLGLLLINASATLMLFFLARRMLGPWPAVAAAAAFAIMSVSPTVCGQAAHATQFVIPFALGSLLVAPAAAKSRRAWRLVFCGALGGLAALMKQPGVFFAAFAGLHVIIVILQDVQHSPGRWTAVVRAAVLFGCGALAPVLLTMLALFACGVFDRFWFWTFQYAREYGRIISPDRGWIILKSEFGGVAVTTWPLWILAALGATSLVPSVTSMSRAVRLWLAGFLLFSFVALAAGLFFRPHYFILLLPAASMLIAGSLRAVGEQLGKAGLPRLAAIAVPAALFAGATAGVLWMNGGLFFIAPPAIASHLIYQANPFPESETIARYIRDHSRPEDGVAIVGSEPQIYVLAQRRSVTGFLCTYPLVEDQPYALSMQKQMIQEIESDPPQFLVLVRIQLSWLRSRNAPGLIFEWSEKFAAANYQRVGIVEILSATRSDFHWDAEARAHEPEPGRPHILLFRRRDSG